MSEQAIVKQEENSVKLGTLTVNSTTAVVTQATMIAKELSKIIEERKVYKIINGKKFPYVEAWTTLGAMLGILPRERYVKEIDDGYEAYIELIRANDGAIIGGASAICTHKEQNWKNREDNAIRSMAITRATSKAFRLALSWIMTLSGYEPTPAEEMDNIVEGEWQDVEPRPSQPPAEPVQTRRTSSTKPAVPANVNKTIRPAAPEVVKERIEKLASNFAKNGEFKPTEQQRNLLRYGLELCFEGQDMKNIDDKRHTLLKYLVGDPSTKNVTGSQFKAIVDKWLEMKPNPDGSGDYIINPFSAEEAESIVAAALVAEGQQELEV